jgi:hypothetical protein
MAKNKTNKNPEPTMWRDRAWKKVIVGKLLDFLIFLIPSLANIKNPNEELDLFDNPVHSMGESKSNKYSRRPDIECNMPVINDDFGMRIFIEQQHETVSNIGKRYFELFNYCRASRPEGTSMGVVFFTGNQPPEEYILYTEKAPLAQISVKFNAFYLSAFDLEVLKNDNRLFAVIFYIARLERTIKNKANKVEIAQTILNHVKNLKLSIEDESFCLEFAKDICRLKGEEIPPELLKEFGMKIISTEQALRKIYVEEAWEEGLEKGLKEGLKKGLEEGRKEGLEEGLEKGLKEGREKRNYEIAEKMLAEKYPISSIASLTGLSRRKLNALRKSLNLPPNKFPPRDV